MRQAAEKGCAGPRERGLLARGEPIRLVEVLAKTTDTGDQHMKKIQRYVGFDVHKDTMVLLASRTMADGARQRGEPTTLFPA